LSFDANTGKPLWHSRIGGISNAPETYSSTGAIVLVAVGDAIYAFRLN
jgi:alcohol dehydrogenase (cytochrome c)